MFSFKFVTLVQQNHLTLIIFGQNWRLWANFLAVFYQHHVHLYPFPLNNYKMGMGIDKQRWAWPLPNKVNFAAKRKRKVRNFSLLKLLVHIIWTYRIVYVSNIYLQQKKMLYILLMGSRGRLLLIYTILYSSSL